MCLKKCPDKTESIPFSKNEILLILKSYIAHPGDFNLIVGEIKENLNHIQLSVRDFISKMIPKKTKQLKATGKKKASHN